MGRLLGGQSMKWLLRFLQRKPRPRCTCTYPVYYYRGDGSIECRNCRLRP
jgi:hypothetical protein